MKDTNFYDKESSNYSAKRYREVPLSYTQYFFGRRLEVVMELIDKVVSADRTNSRSFQPSLLEVGCADGVVLKKISETLQGKFISMVGIDISPKMIETARMNVKVPWVSFMERKDFRVGDPYGVVLEVGVANYADVHEELDFAAANLPVGGFYILSLAGRGSMWSFRQMGQTGFKNFLRYREYEKLIREKFEVVEVRPVGLFTPLIWKWPSFARTFQPFKEKVNAKIVPNLFHEKVYLLRKK